MMLYRTRAVAVTYLHLMALSRRNYETLGEQYPMECALMRRRIIRDTFVADIMLAAHKIRLQRWETGQQQPSTPATTGGDGGGGNGPAGGGGASGTDSGGGPAAPVPAHAEQSQLSLRAPAGLVIMPNGDSAAHTSDVKLYLGAAPEEDEEEEDDDEEDEDVPISSLSPRRSPSPDRRWQAP